MTTPMTQHHMPTHPSDRMQQHVLDRIAGTLARRFDGAVPAATVRSVVAEVADALQAEARITTYLPALVEHDALRRLEGMAGAPAAMTITHTQLSAA